MTAMMFYRRVMGEAGLERNDAKRATAAVLQALRDRLTPLSQLPMPRYKPPKRCCVTVIVTGGDRRSEPRPPTATTRARAGSFDTTSRNESAHTPCASLEVVPGGL